MFNDINELENLISSKQEALERNNKILEDLNNISDDEYREREQARIREDIDRLQEELSSLQSQRESMKPNEEIIDKIRKYEDLEHEERELRNRRLIQERELESLEQNRPEEPEQEYFDRLNEYNESIEAISKHMDDVREELADLDKEFDLYSEEEISRAIQSMSSEEVQVEEEKEEVEEEIGFEITQEIEELERKYLEVVEKGKEAQREIHGFSTDLAEAYAKQIKRYETLIRKNNGEEPEYVTYLTEKIEEARKRQDYFQVVSEDTLPEEIEVEENFEEKEVSKLEEETIEAQISINELEERLAEAQKNKEYFDQEAIRFSQELVERNQELIDMINASELEDKQELKELERDQTTKRLQLAIQKRDSYQAVINDLQAQIEERQREEVVEEPQEEVQEERVVTRSAKQLLSDMDRLSETLQRRQVDLDAANDALAEYRISNGVDMSDIERVISIDEQRLIDNVARAQKAYDEQYGKLREKQEDYKVAAADIAAVGTEKKNKLINAEDGSLIGTRPAFTDASAKVEGQIDGSALREMEETPPPADNPDGNEGDDTSSGDRSGNDGPPDMTFQPDPLLPIPVVPEKGKEPEEKEEEPDEPTRVPEPPKEEPIAKEPEKRKGRVLEKILVDLYTDKETGEPINVTHLQRKRLERSQISVTRNFINDVNNGNVLYNVTSIAGAVIRLPLSLVQKLTGKILTTRRTKKNMKLIEENFDALPDEDKEVLATEYINNKAFQDRAKGADGVILRKVIEYKREKDINPRVSEAGNIFAGAFAAYQTNLRLQSIVDALNDGMSLDQLKDIPGATIDVKNASREDIIREIQALQSSLMAGQAHQLGRFKELEKELAAQYSGGGIHGLEEEARAKGTKMNERGKRFSSDVGTGDDFEGRKMRADVEQALVDAIERGDDAAAVTLFVKGEQLKLKAEEQGLTFVRVLGVPIFPAGIGDKGTVKYMPLPQEMDYRPDPFIRNMITTIATVATIAHAINQFQERMEIRRDNEAKLEQQEYVRSKGDDLASKDKEFERGMEHQREADFVSRRNHDEMNDTYYTDTSHYRVNDPAHHMELRHEYEAVNDRIADINQQMQSGTITAQEGYRQIMDINQQVHDAYIGALKEHLPAVKEYAATHPQHDYNVVIPAMEKAVSDPSALDAFNRAFFDSIQTGQELQGFTLEMLPTHTADMIIGLGGAALITGYVASQGQKAYQKPEQTLTDIVEDSLDFEERSFYTSKDKEEEYEEEIDQEEKEEDQDFDERILDVYTTPDYDKDEALREMLGEYAPEEERSIKM